LTLPRSALMSPAIWASSSGWQVWPATREIAEARVVDRERRRRHRHRQRRVQCRVDVFDLAPCIADEGRVAVVGNGAEQPTSATTTSSVPAAASISHFRSPIVRDIGEPRA
jgi:hypothetical protein